MGDAANLQPSFHGGEWSPFTQGRMDRPDYRAGMSTCLNGIPLEEAAWTRRPGFRRVGYTRAGGYAQVREFHFSNAEPYLLELTALHLRLLSGAPHALNNSGLVLENSVRGVMSISSATPASVATSGDHGWDTGDMVMFQVSATATAPEAGRLLNRQFAITDTGDNTFTLADAVTGDALDGSTVDIPSAGLFVGRIWDEVTPYPATALAAVQVVQDNRTLALFHEDYQPRRLIADLEPSTCENAEFTLSTGTLIDGPYFDPFDDAPTITPSGLSGSVTLTKATAAFPFVSTDVGRAVRLFSEPPTWSAVTAYAAGDSVKYKNDYYTALAVTTGDDPLLTPATWSINPNAAQWAWGYITAVASTTVCTLALDADVPLLYTSAIALWRMGLYSDTTGWPTGAAFHNGRLWIWGRVLPNRVDGSMSNGGFAKSSIGLFSPTAPDGTVADNHAVAAVFRSTSVNPTYWGVSDDQGLILGTKSNEWLVRGSDGSAAITPTSIDAKPVSRYGSSSVEPVRVGDALLFVNRFNRKLMEYMAGGSTSSPKYSASNLTLKSKHLSASGLTKLAYQHELVPVVWAITGLGGLIGMTYKKDGEFNGVPEDIQGWHRHTHGDARTFVDIAAGPTGQGLDTLYAVTHADGVYQIEQLSLIFGQNAAATTGNFLDASTVPTAAETYGVGPLGIRYYGLDHLEGQEVTVWAAGLDCGEFTVTDGVVEVPYGSADGEFTAALLTTITAENSTFLGLVINVYASSAHTAPVPSVTGITTMLPGAETITAPGDTGPVLVPASKALYTVQAGNNNTLSGYRKHNLETGALLASITRGAFVTAGADASIYVGGLAVSDAGNVYTSGGLSNTEAIYKLNADFATYGGQWGTASGGTGGTGGMLAPDELIAVTVGNVDFFAGISFAFDPLRFVIGCGTSMDIADRWAINVGGSYKRGHIAAGAVTTSGCTSSGKIYVLATDDTTPNTLLGIWVQEIVVSPDGTYTVGGGTIIDPIAPSAIDANWTAYGTNPSSFNVDQTDGNLLAVVTGNAAPTQKLVKFNAATGAVMWATAIASDAPDLGGWQRSYIRNGSLVWKGTVAVATNTYNTYSLNTLTGVVTTTGTVIGTSGPTVWDGVNGWMVGHGAYTKATPGYPVATPDATFLDRYYRFNGVGGSTANQTYNAPCAIGFTYTSQGQVLRPILDAGARNGPALGKTRRVHQYALLLQRSGPLFVGTDFTTMRPVQFKNPNGTAYTFGTLYSGLVQDTLEDDYTFNGQVAWSITRPVPSTLLAVESFLQTQDR